MTVYAVTNPYPLVLGLLGTGLNGGRVFIGQPNQDPQAFPQNVYWDAAGTQLADQSSGLATIGGYISNSGTPAAIYTASPFSIRIRDAQGVQVYAAASINSQVADFITSLSASSGSALSGFIQSGTGAVARTAQSKMRDAVSVFDFMTTAQIADVQAGTALINVTAAIEAALAAHNNVYAPAGTYLVDIIDLPLGSPDKRGLNFSGAGVEKTIFQASATNQIVFRKTQSAGVIEFSTFENFSIKAHASGSTGTAFDCSGFRNVTFRYISGMSNGSSGFNSLFSVAASPYLSYGITWEKCGMAGTTGWTQCWKFHNNGAGAGSNPNAMRIIDPWIYSNTGMTYGIDIANCTAYEITGGVIESSAQYGIRLGSRGRISNVWLETQSVAPLRFQNSESVVSANNILEGLYISGFTGDIAIPNGCASNLFQNCSGAYTITPATAADGNMMINSPSGAAPSVAQYFGTAGTLALVDTTQRIFDGLWILEYNFTPGAAPANAGFRLTPASGYSIKRATFSAYDAANGVPYTTSVDQGLTDFLANFPNTNICKLVFQVAYQ